MISRKELNSLALTRLRDAELLYKSKRYDGAAYICGYVIELGLKKRICRTLKWVGFPSTSREFEDFKSFRTHKFDVLLKMSGIEDKVKNRYFVEWSTVTFWDPEVRYKPRGSTSASEAYLMIESAKKLLKIL
jgi:HEPN domain-containing protein